MEKGETKPVLVAADTNVLLDLALGDEDTRDAIDIIRGANKNVRFLVTPTVIQELAWQATNENGETRHAAELALGCLLKWGFEPLNLIPVGHGLVEQIALKMRLAGIIPEVEVHDSEIVAEAALIGCSLLLSSDSDLLDAQEEGRLLKFLEECHVEGDRMVIGRPKTIASRFFHRR